MHKPMFGTLWRRVSFVCVLVLVAVALLASLTVLTVGATAPASVAAAPLAQTATWSGFFPTGWNSMLPVSSGITVSDPNGLNDTTARYRITTNGGQNWTAWTADGLGVSATGPDQLTLQVDGLNLPDSLDGNRIQFRIETANALLRESSVHVIAVDTVAPASPSNLQSDPSGWTNRNWFTETWSNPVDTSGIVGAYYQFNREPTHPTDGVFVPTSDTITGIQVPQEGTHSISLWLLDAAGNLDHRNYRVDLGAFRYDGTPPLVGMAAQGTLGRNGWYTETVTVNFTPFDALSGLESWGWTLDAITTSNAASTVLVGDRVHSLVVTATDQAGNQAAPATYDIAIDGSRPVLSHFLSQPTSASGWYTAPLAVSFSLSDAVSGPAGVTWQLDQQLPVNGTSVAVTDEGPHWLEAYGIDVAGNRSEKLGIPVSLDLSAPSSSLSISPLPASSGYYTAWITLDFEASDDALGLPVGWGSGVAATWMRWNQGFWQLSRNMTLNQNGFYRLDFYSQDVAGNVEISHTQMISLDALAPASPLAARVEPAGWVPSNQFRLSWTNPAETSGVVGARIHWGEDPPGSGDGQFYGATTDIPDLAVPGEGQWAVWLWLQDAAGNQDPASAVQPGYLRYDATPPAVNLEVVGPPGNAGWHVGPIQVTLTISDGGSGPDALRYRLDGQAWQEVVGQQEVLTFDQAGRHVLEYLGRDVAGLQTGPRVAALRVDGEPPGPPIALSVAPSSWSNTNQFTVTWRNPVDTSGVSLAHVSLVEPEDPQDGQAFAAGTQSLVLEAPAEGQYDLYMWLEDVAGNVALDQLVQQQQAMNYDATPPTTTVRYSIAPNPSGWFRSPILVYLDAVDEPSGVATTTYRLNDGDSVDGSQLIVEHDGTHSLTVYSVDHAGNQETPSTHTIRIDTQAPTVRLHPVSSGSPSPVVRVQWDGRDNDPAEEKESLLSSGLAGFDVQVREGTSGSWQPWLTDTADTEADFEGQRGEVYAFRVRAADKAGNVSAWHDASGQNQVYIDPVVNGFFWSGNFDGWQQHTGIAMVVLRDEGPDGDPDTRVGRLGRETYQACSNPGNVPTDKASISQVITVPSLAKVARPTLSVWYRIRTYDQMMITDTHGNVQWVDTFEVTVRPTGVAEPDVLLRDGNPVPIVWSGNNPPIPFWDLGWRLATLDLTPYAGRAVTVELANHNRRDNRFNTWTDVYGIRVAGTLWEHSLWLPLIADATSTEFGPVGYCYPLGPGVEDAWPWDGDSPSRQWESRDSGRTSR